MNSKFGRKQKGYFFQQSRIKIIVINSSLPEDLQRIICAHELGHALLHKDLAAKNTLNDFALFDTVAKPEFEANLFAAELLISDNAVIEGLNDDLSFFGVASALYAPAELLDLKFRILKHKGYRLEAPIHARGDFLRH
ncbi:ImmA/IrrE family metallo-endopeptidase [Desulfosporosinus sp. Sb-LF]|uniref:ImmA/IrrE family metallo-endopeptidase n=1 Tax=Desulfosporosinus sp. Sb-LF TaxID=2560027 RepID=UPI00107F991D|nr:ImmA/IrrE family metallo-endopeptidase [Desulfosporosinus sp. Sb-LF]TGE31893.1 ImmA/IrrE family metallo-endopeptidase [Desulfosporosinus sp. Sb-LF]